MNLHCLQQDSTPTSTAVTWSVCCAIANLAICFLGYWRCFANNYLHWAAVCTWVLFNVQGKCNRHKSCVPHATIICFRRILSFPFLFASLINLLLPHSVLLHSIHWRRRGFCESRVPGLVHAVRHLCAVCHVAAAAQVVRCGRHNHRQLSPGRNYHQEIAGQGGKSTIIVQFNFGLCLIWPFRVL